MCGVSRYKVNDVDKCRSDESTKKGPHNEGDMVSSDN